MPLDDRAPAQTIACEMAALAEDGVHIRDLEALLHFATPPT